MTDTDDRRAALDRNETAAQWLLAAVTNDDDMLGELEDATEQACPCCTAVVSGVLARLAASLSVQLHGRTGAERHAEQLLAHFLDELDALDKDDE